MATACSSDGSTGEVAASLPDSTMPTSTTLGGLGDREALDPSDVNWPRDEVLSDLVSAAIAELSLMLKVDDGMIVVRTAEAVMWPDASLGCPEDDLFYAQMLTPGYRVGLEVAGARHWYHAGGDGVGRLCEDARLPVKVVEDGIRLIPSTTTP